MNGEIHKHSLRNMMFQRNASLGLTTLLAASLVIVTSFLFMKSERVIVIPAAVEKEFWVDAHSVSATYLEQFGYFLGELLLSKSSQSSAIQKAIVLRHTDPSFSTQLDKKLFEEAQQLERDRISYVFFPTGVYTNLGSKEVRLSGERTTYISGKQISSATENYVLSFTYRGGRLLLNGITALEGTTP